MKFVELHLKYNNEKFSVNPMLISAMKPLKEGGTRIYYTLLSQHDDVTEEYYTVLMKINDALRS